MQQRLSNQWLSDELIEAVARKISSEESNDATNGGAASKSAGMQTLRAKPKNHRRVWLRLATTVLLAGSAAFSYLAWSQAELGLQGTPLVGAAAAKKAPRVKTALRTEPSAIAPATDKQTDSREQSPQASVNALREKNWELQQRIAQITKGIEGATP